jgi:MbtH protein
MPQMATVCRTDSQGAMKETEQMNGDENEDQTTYKVVVNHEEQYSIWPAEKQIPLGWKDAGRAGTKVECLSYVKKVWTDMRPLSVRSQMGPREKPIVPSNS